MMSSGWRHRSQPVAPARHFMAINVATGSGRASYGKLAPCQPARGYSQPAAMCRLTASSCIWIVDCGGNDGRRGMVESERKEEGKNCGQEGIHVRDARDGRLQPPLPLSPCVVTSLHGSISIVSLSQELARLVTIKVKFKTAKPTASPQMREGRSQGQEEGAWHSV